MSPYPIHPPFAFRLRSGLAGLLCLLSVGLAACGERAAPPPPQTDAPLRVGPENLWNVVRTRVQAGPLLSGTLRPERRAEVRAEIGGTLREAGFEPGQTVAAGDVLARLDERAVRDARDSAQSGVTSAERAAVMARRNAERADELLKTGAYTRRQQEDAWVASIGADATLADARARLAAADKQLAYTVVHAPMAGRVAERPVTAGDVVPAGATLYVLVDPASMRLEAAVPAAELPRVQPGADVEFSVRGYPQRRFRGVIERINPMADPLTRQVTLYVALPNADGTLLGGLYAEGRVAADVREAAVLPLDAVAAGATQAQVWRIRDGRLEAVAVRLGLRDAEAGLVEVLDGLAPGDTVLLRPARTPVAGTRVEILPELR